jgi:hypothetical protein
VLCRRCSVLVLGDVYRRGGVLIQMHFNIIIFIYLVI